VGTTTALAASLYAFLLHAAIKAGLFLVAGGVTHETGAKAFSELDHTARPSRPLAVMAAVLLFALSGVPLGAAFHYKEKLLHATDEAGAWPIVGLLLAGAGLTAAYALRFFLETFVRGRRAPRTPHPAPWTMLAPTGALALIALWATLRPGWASGLVTRAARDASGGEVFFQVGHALGAVTWTSIAIVLGGLAAYAALRRRTRLRGVARRLPGELLLGGRHVVTLYGGLSERILDLHDGNLRHYLRVILLSLAVLFGLFTFAWARFPSAPITDVDPILVGGLIASIAPAAVVVLTTNYVVMVIALNVTGYAMAVVFLHMHAPNVAIAQVLVETLAPLIFVMALRQTHGTTPETQSHRLRPKHDPWRWPTSIALGLVIGLVTYMAREGGRSESVGSWYATHGEKAGGARDHVAAILADFRALDTVVEALVFAVAMLGVVGLYHGMKAAR
ncbi:MAG: hydrogen gas-evolving membrane-bound hydrogenase subunit E, partial [Myxococcota bacterium]